MTCAYERRSRLESLLLLDSGHDEQRIDVRLTPSSEANDFRIDDLFAELP